MKGQRSYLFRKPGFPCPYCRRQTVIVYARPADDKRERRGSVRMDAGWKTRQRLPYRRCLPGDIGEIWVRPDGDGETFVWEFGYQTSDITSPGVRFGWQQHRCEVENDDNE